MIQVMYLPEHEETVKQVILTVIDPDTFSTKTKELTNVQFGNKGREIETSEYGAHQIFNELAWVEVHDLPIPIYVVNHYGTGNDSREYSLEYSEKGEVTLQRYSARDLIRLDIAADLLKQPPRTNTWGAAADNYRKIMFDKLLQI